MTTICPTVLAQDVQDYTLQMRRILPFTRRVQIDLTDGQFAPVKTVSLPQVSWPANMQADLHLMYQNPAQHLKAIVALRPRLVIVHAEAEGDFLNFARLLHKFGIEVGVALLPETPVTVIEPAMEHIDHVLIFSGDLGKFGGTADLSLLAKAQEVKQFKPSVEVGWDGGINEQNAHLLAAGGVDVLNVGGFIQKASNPAAAYAKLKAQVANR